MMRYVKQYYLIMPGKTIPCVYNDEKERAKEVAKLSKIDKIKAVVYSGIVAINLGGDDE